MTFLNGFVVNLDVIMLRYCQKYNFKNIVLENNCYFQKQLLLRKYITFEKIDCSEKVLHCDTCNITD